MLIEIGSGKVGMGMGMGSMGEYVSHKLSN